MNLNYMTTIFHYKVYSYIWVEVKRHLLISPIPATPHPHKTDEFGIFTCTTKYWNSYYNIKIYLEKYYSNMILEDYMHQKYLVCFLS